MGKQAQYKRIVLKISGQAMCPIDGTGIEGKTVSAVIDELQSVIDLGVEVALVVGGGNFIRGRDLADSPAIRRVTADSMGMLATVMNAIALRDSMESAGVKASVMSAIPMGRICDDYGPRQASRCLEAGQVVILAGGTGNPFFTTDMCAALRASELNAEIMMKATKVDGVFDDDPETNPQARQYDSLTYNRVLADRLGVMDLTAISLCMENRIPIVVFQLTKPGNLLKAVTGQKVGTIVSD